ncbi:MAG: 2TM domain-containing protein [Tenacibaculum sp.]
MGTSNFLELEKYIKAKKRIKELKGYYWHLITYLVVNVFITLAQIIEGLYQRETIKVIFSDFGVYGVWIIWGISLFFHTLKTFGYPNLPIKNWEERKIKEYMNNDKF